MKIFPTKESPDANDFTGEFYWMSKEDLTKFVFKLFQTKEEREEKKRKEEKGTYLNTFYEANTTLIPIPDKDHNKTKL